MHEQRVRCGSRGFNAGAADVIIIVPKNKKLRVGCDYTPEITPSSTAGGIIKLVTTAMASAPSLDCHGLQALVARLKRVRTTRHYMSKVYMVRAHLSRI